MNRKLKTTLVIIIVGMIIVSAVWAINGYREKRKNERKQHVYKCIDYIYAMGASYDFERDKNGEIIIPTDQELIDVVDMYLKGVKGSNILTLRVAYYCCQPFSMTQITPA